MIKNMARIAAFLSCVLGSVIGLSTLQAAAQSPLPSVYLPLASAPDTKFDVASVKISGPDQYELNGFYTFPGARVEARGAWLRFLLMEAYHLPPRQIVGGPAWADTTRFDIVAKPPASVAERYSASRDPKIDPPDEIRQMLQNLLAERFQLKVHVEQRNGQIYELVRNGKPLHLDSPKNKNEFPWAGSPEGGVPDRTGLRGTNESMPDLAFRLTRWLRTPVVDRTGLSGSYDFLAEYPSDESGLGWEDGIFQPLQQLGLELKKTTGIVHTLVIDQASLPSPD